MIQAQYTGDSVFSNSSEAFSLFDKSRFGEKVRERIEYSFVEALYLVREGKLQVLSEKVALGFDELMRKIKRIEKRIEIKYQAYRDLRKRGFIVKTALKFGADFRVYERGVKPGEAHAYWLLHVARENEQLRWHEFAAKNRVAHSTRKKLLLGIVDEEGDVSYYQCEWIRM